MNKTIADFKRCIHIFSTLTQAFTIAYLLYSILSRSGTLWADIPLLIIATAYFIFYIITYKANPTKQEKRLYKIAKAWVRRTRLIIRTLTIVVLVYGVFTTVGGATPLSVILLAVTLVGWVLQVLFELVTALVEKYANMFLEAMKADIEPITAPVRKAGDFFKKLAGKETQPPAEPTKTRLALDKIVGVAREERKAKKEEKKREKLEEKRKKAEAKRALKAELAASKSEEKDKE